MNLLDIIVETKRLLLVPISDDFRDRIFEEFTEEVARYTFPQPTGQISDTDTFIHESRTLMQQGTDYQVVACRKETGEFVGCAGLHHLDTQPEPGLWLKKAAWNKGYGTEIVAGLKEFANQCVDHEYLYYPVAKENWGSRNIAEKVGGVLQPGERKVRNMCGKKVTEVVYRIYR